MPVLELFQAAVVLGVFVLVMRGLASGAARAEAGRRTELESWADAHGWTYQASDPGVPRLKVRESSILTALDPSDVMRGSIRGLPVVAYADHTSVGNSSIDLYVVAIRLPVSVPYLQVSPRVEPRWATARGVDVRLELSVFDEIYEVRTEDPRYAHAVLHPLLMERLLTRGSDGLVWRTEGDWIWSWDVGPLAGNDVVRHGALLADIVASVPRHVWDDAMAARVVAPAPTWTPQPDGRLGASDR